MSSKRPTIDLMALTSPQAAPMPEAAQRAAQPSRPATKGQATAAPANVEPLNFRVSKEFRKRFRRRAFEADLKLNALLAEALEAWERERGL